MSLKILFEGSPMFRNRSGVGQYVYNLFKSLAQEDKNNRYVVFGFLLAGKKFEPPVIADNIKYKLIRYFPSKLYSIASRKLAPPPVDLLLAEKYDLALFTNFVSTPLFFTKKSIAVIYDLSYEYVPEYSVKKNRQLLAKQVPKTLKRSTGVVTISENSKKEIIGRYNINPTLVHVIYPAVDHSKFKAQSKALQAKAAKKYHINKPYLLSVCTLEPRKNLIGVLSAFNSLPEETKNQYALVLVGGKGWLDEELQAKFDELGSKYTLIKTGYVPDDDLPALYSGASVFVYPSFYEGFGMPPLEAMACGTPVITSNNSSLPEVVGDAAITIDAKDTARLSKEIVRVLSDKTLAAQMRKKGLVQAKKFNWDKSAQTLLKVIEEVSAK